MKRILIAFSLVGLLAGCDKDNLLEDIDLLSQAEILSSQYFKKESLENGEVSYRNPVVSENGSLYLIAGRDPNLNNQPPSGANPTCRYLGHLRNTSKYSVIADDFNAEVSEQLLKNQYPDLYRALNKEYVYVLDQYGNPDYKVPLIGSEIVLSINCVEKFHKSDLDQYFASEYAESVELENADGKVVDKILYPLTKVDGQLHRLSTFFGNDSRNFDFLCQHYGYFWAKRYTYSSGSIPEKYGALRDFVSEGSYYLGANGKLEASPSGTVGLDELVCVGYSQEKIDKLLNTRYSKKEFVRTSDGKNVYAMRHPLIGLENKLHVVGILQTNKDAAELDRVCQHLGMKGYSNMYSVTWGATYQYYESFRKDVVIFMDKERKAYTIDINGNPVPKTSLDAKLGSIYCWE